MAEEAKEHLSFYLFKGLLVEAQGLAEVAAWMVEGRQDASEAAMESTLLATVEAYNLAADEGGDPFGKTVFPNAPVNLNGGFFVGRVCPVLHYCMGGLRIDEHGCVLRADGSRVEGLYAAGEVTGGIHGANRLGGNSLLDCVVFGSLVGDNLARRVKPL